MIPEENFCGLLLQASGFSSSSWVESHFPCPAGTAAVLVSLPGLPNHFTLFQGNWSPCEQLGVLFEQTCSFRLWCLYLDQKKKERTAAASYDPSCHTYFDADTSFITNAPLSVMGTCACCQGSSLDTYNSSRHDAHDAPCRHEKEGNEVRPRSHHG